MMDRLTQTFTNSNALLNIYFTAGYPNLNDTVKIAKQLDKSGVDIIEIGMPFSDPLADGKTIQNSSQIALKNGITLDKIFHQVTEIRAEITELPIVLMGYLNQLLQFKIDLFLKRAKLAGVDALIIPDLPLDVYIKEYKSLFEFYGIKICFLITPQTPKQRVLEISKFCTGFIYMVSTYSTTGNKMTLSPELINYFTSIHALNLKTPQLIGFGIHDSNSFNTATKYAHGAIIGSAFIKALDTKGDIKENINRFIQSIR